MARPERRSDPAPVDPPEPSNSGDDAKIRSLLTERRWSRLAERLGYSPTEIELTPEAARTWNIPPDLARELDRLRVLAAGRDYRLLFARGDVSHRDFRRAVLNCHRKNPLHCVVWWWVRAETVSVCCADRRPEGRPFVRRMETSLRHPDPVSLRQWRELSIDDLPDPDAHSHGEGLRRHVRETLDQEGLTREFFEGFRGALDRLTDELREGPDDDRLRHEIALATLLRLVFLYFLQRREILDGDRRFVLRHLRAARADGRNYYRTVLRPLFFGALNTSPDDRGERARKFGALPFLNGGLFEPLPAESEHPDLRWPNEVWDDVVEELLEQYHFTADEGAEEDRCRAVDPEMLGNVFEGLMYGESRHESGSFYTPRDIVRRLVLDALQNHLADDADISAELARNLLVPDRQLTLRSSVRERILESLRETTVLDPAAGTGAFLLESMRRLSNCYRHLDAAPPDCPADASEFQLRTYVVHHHLFGVDIERTAVRICELRLWLALFASLPEDSNSVDDVPPLPNLSHRIGCGNSLFSPRDLFEVAVDTENHPSPWAPGLPRETRDRHRDRVQRLQRRLLSAHGDEKVSLRRELQQLEDDFQRTCLQARLERLEERLDPLERLAESPDLFGEQRSLSREQRSERTELHSAVDAVRQTLEAVDERRNRSAAFDYAARFGPALEEDGFDIVVTNPPWVRANRLESSRRSLLRNRYQCFSNDLWPGADDLGVRAPFGTQTDLAALFVERSLELLRPGGRFGGLLPAKVFRSLHGAGLRRLIGRHDLVSIEDFSDADRQIFDATVYPSVLHLQKEGRPTPSGTASTHRSTPSTSSDRQPRTGSVELSVWTGRDRDVWETDRPKLYATGDHPAEPWVFAPPNVSRLLTELRADAVPLGSVDALHPARGVMTGRNEVFLGSDREMRDLLGDRSQEFSRPVIEGRDIREGESSPGRRILWPYESPSTPNENLPPRLRRYFERHRDELEARADHRENGPLWQLFRLKPGLDDPKVVWRDLAPRLEAAVVGRDYIPLNTVYFISAPDPRRADTLAALLNSEPIRAAAYALGERARGGWRRHFCWVVRMLPIPQALAAWFDDPERPDPSSDAARRYADSADEPRTGVSRSRLEAEIFDVNPDDLTRLRDWRTASPALEEPP